MTIILGLVIASCLAGIAFLCWRLIGKARERERSEEARFAAFMEARRSAAAQPPASGAAPISAPSPAPQAPASAGSLAQEKLLFEAAAKAAEAGEPALAVQLYGRLLARFPRSAFAGEVRAAVEAQKRKLVKT